MLRGSIYFCLFVLIQVLFLNNIYYLRIVTPFLYLYFLIKLPIDTSRVAMLLLSFGTGLVIDMFSNTHGLHAAACTFAGFYRNKLLNLVLDKEISYRTYPSFRNIGVATFLKYIFLFISVHCVTLFLIESFSFFDLEMLAIRIASGILLTTLVICVVEAFNMEGIKYGK